MADSRLATIDGSIGFGPTVWYRYTSTFAGRVSVDSIGSSVASFVDAQRRLLQRPPRLVLTPAAGRRTVASPRR